MQLFQSVADHLRDGVIVARLDTIITYANPAIRAMSGFGEQLLTMSFMDLYPSATRAQLNSEDVARIRAAGHWENTVELLRPDGTIWVAQVSGVVLENPEDHQLVWVSIFRDVTVQQQTEKRLRLFEQIVANTPDSIGTGVPPTSILNYVNPAFVETLGYSADEVIGTSIGAYVAENPAELQAEMMLGLAQGKWQGILNYRRKDGSTFPGLLSAFNTYDAQGQPETMIGIFRDMSVLHQAEQDRSALQQQIIDAQQAALQELSMPLIPIMDGLLVLPLIGNVDSRRAQDFIETLLTGVADQRAATVIVDITGVQVVDTQVASLLIRAAQAVKLLGAQVLLTGIRPEVAQTLVGLGVNLGDIITRSTLQDGIAYAIKATR